MQEIYSLRKSFSIIGLTGRMGSGCSKFAEMISVPKTEFFGDSNSEFLRNPQNISVEGSVTNIFKRKYTICYNFAEKNWLKYQVVDYKKALILYCIDYYKSESDPVTFFVEMICDLFKKSKIADGDFPELLLDKGYLTKSLVDLNFESIISYLKTFQHRLNELKSETDLDTLHSIYFHEGGAFTIIYNFIINYLKSRNYYLRTFLFHKLANNIRSTGDPLRHDNSSGNHIYSIAKLVNRIIKAYKSRNAVCHIVINSLKNSLEIMFFKERYSAFYIAAIHNKSGYKERIARLVSGTEHEIITQSKLIDLDAIEYKSDSFSDGIFSAPDIQNCIQKSEIHISDNDERSKKSDFITLNEQIIKYMALLQQPGIITPSAVERCMQIAYNAKFNSGCISRQVGAVITDKGYSLKAIGWNDVPQGSTPCILRGVDELVSKQDSIDYNTYSEYELTTNEDYLYKLHDTGANKASIDKSFNQNMQMSLLPNAHKVTEQGKNCSFCFKSNHNKFEGKDNQVHTRSLHAEENAMLQIAKHGGQPLLNGILFTTASPCELCSKKAYQLGVTTVIYIDPYPGISTAHVLNNGYNKPDVQSFNGVIGKSYNKLYEPFISYKDELKLMMKAED